MKKLRIGFAEGEGGIPSHVLIDNDDFSASLRYSPWSDLQPDAWMAVPFVRGSPYVTAAYAGLSVKITAIGGLIGSVLIRETIQSPDSVVGCHDGKALMVSRVQFTVEATDATWAVYFSKPTSIDVLCDNDGNVMIVSKEAVKKRYAPRADAKSGETIRAHFAIAPLIVRVSLVSNCTTGINPHFCSQSVRNLHETSQSYSKYLDNHVDSVALGGSVNWGRYSSSGTTLEFDWNLVSFAGHKEPKSSLLALTLPHHRRVWFRSGSNDMLELIGENFVKNWSLLS